MTDTTLIGRTGFRYLKIFGLSLVGLSLFAMGYVLGGQNSIPVVEDGLPTSEVASYLVQLQPSDPRELLPLPGQGEDGGQGAAPGECPVYLYQDGQLFQLPPGQPLPGQPTPGGGSPELIPLDPAPGSPLPWPSPLPPSLDPPRYAHYEQVAEAPRFLTGLSR